MAVFSLKSHRRETRPSFPPVARAMLLLLCSTCRRIPSKAMDVLDADRSASPHHLLQRWDRNLVRGTVYKAPPMPNGFRSVAYPINTSGNYPWAYFKFLVR